MPRTLTKHLGEIEYTDEEVVRFPLGLPAFENEHRFLMLADPATRPLVLLQSLTDPTLCFITLPVSLIEPNYSLSILAEDLVSIGLPPEGPVEIGSNVKCFTILTIGDGRPPTANLLAPVLLNLKDRLAVQAVQVDTKYCCKQELNRREERTCS